MANRSTLLSEIGTTFNNHELLRIALTHPSAANEITTTKTDSNQRLEFLGDSLIGLVVANEIFSKLPEKPEGYLTDLRSSLVRKETLASVAKRISLGDYLLFGQGEKQNGGQYRDSNLASGLEALMGAILLDQGINKAYTVVAQLLTKDIEAAIWNGVTKDPKSALQELTQSIGKGSPQYILVQQTPVQQNKNFVIEVILDSEVIGNGEGPRKLDAERVAATRALETLRLLRVNDA